VAPIVKVRSEAQLEHAQLIAVNQHYICYALKGNIRVLDRVTVTKELFKGHPQVRAAPPQNRRQLATLRRRVLAAGAPGSTLRALLAAERAAAG
jgi:hypothetical protein